MEEIDVNKLKEKIKNVEMVKIEVLLEFDEVKKMVEYFNYKLEIRNNNMRSDEKGLVLRSSSSNVRDVSLELGIVKELF